MREDPRSRVDLEKGRRVYEETRARLIENPSAGRTTIRVVASLEEDMHLRGRAGKFTFEADEPAIRGGTDLGPTPLQYFVAGAAFCLITQMARFAPLYDVPLEEVRADVRAEFTITGKFDVEEGSGAFDRVTYAVQVQSPAPWEQVRLLIEHAERACHAAQSLRASVPVVLDVELNGEALPLARA